MKEFFFFCHRKLNLLEQFFNELLFSYKKKIMGSSQSFEYSSQNMYMKSFSVLRCCQKKKKKCSQYQVRKVALFNDKEIKKRRIRNKKKKQIWISLNKIFHKIERLKKRERETKKQYIATKSITISQSYSAWKIDSVIFVNFT